METPEQSAKSGLDRSVNSWNQLTIEKTAQYLSDSNGTRQFGQMVECSFTN